jgi:hypothetical protein
MHQIVLLAAMSAASGLLGGSRQCSTGQCPRAATYRSYYQAPVAPYAQTYAAPAPVAPAQVMAPAYVAPRASYRYYQSAYPFTQAVAGCPNGNCPKR